MPNDIDFCPFLHSEQVKKYIPDIYYSNEEGSISYSWFLNAPKYSTFRVNTVKYCVEEVLERLTKQIQEEADSKCVEAPFVKIHQRIPDCIVIGHWGRIEEKDPNIEEVIVDVPCANAVLRGADVFAPGILGLTVSSKKGNLVNIVADIEKKCKRGFNKGFSGRTYYVGKGILRMDRNDLFKNNAAPKGVGVEVIHNLTGIPKINLARDVGILQNLPSIVCGRLFSNVSGYILDMCAAPGNKATHIATILGNKGYVTALDKTPNKVARLKDLCSDMGLQNIRCHVFDSTKCLNEDGKSLCEKLKSNFVEEGPPFPPSSFFAVLLDAPCSGLGQRPNLYNTITSSQLESYINLQQRLFRKAVELLAPGGLLVYSTCTITVEENEEIVAWALREYRCLSLEKIYPEIGKHAVKTSSLSERDQRLVNRFGYPGAVTPDEDTIGFFIAKFVKSC